MWGEKATRVTIDYETVTFDKDNVVPRPICISYIFDTGEKGILIGDEISPFLFRIFNDEEILIIAHNMSFELQVTAKYFPKLLPLIYKKLENNTIYCTLIYEKLINLIREYPKQGFTLADLAFNYLNIDLTDEKTDPKAWRLRYVELEGIPVNEWPIEAYNYSLNDSIYADKVYLHQSKADKLEYGLHMKAIFTLNLMAKTGIEVDKQRVLNLEKEILDKLEPSYKFLEEKGFMEWKDESYSLKMAPIKLYFQKKSIKSIVYTKSGISLSKVNLQKYIDETSDSILKLLYEYKINGTPSGTLEDLGFIVKNEAGYKTKEKEIVEYIKTLGIERYSYTATGGIGTGTDALKSYLAQIPNEVLEHLVYVNKYKNILSNFVTNLKKADNRIYCEYFTPLDTGRTSCKGSKFYPSTNLQNQPRTVEDVTYDLRNCYIPPKGFKICSIDFKFLELASTASQLLAIYGESKMADAVNYGYEPADLHSIYSAHVMSYDKRRKVTYEEFIENLHNPEYKKYRQQCKTANLSFPGGIGYDKLGGMMRKNGVNTKFQILVSVPKHEKWKLKYAYKQLKADHPELREARLSKWEYGLVLDEIVEMKQRYLSLYPELGTFLKETHLKYIQYYNGQPVTKWIKNEFDEPEEEVMYQFETHGMRRKFATYTKICNGYLMQIPGAAGAKNAMYLILKEFYNHANVVPMAFVHDEFVFAYRIGHESEIERIGAMMVENMAKALPGVKISVEADFGMDYWMKELGEQTFTMWKPANDKLQIKY